MEIYPQSVLPLPRALDAIVYRAPKACCFKRAQGASTEPWCTAEHAGLILSRKGKRPGLCPHGKRQQCFGLPLLQSGGGRFSSSLGRSAIFPPPLLAALLMTSCRTVLICFQDLRAGSEVTVVVCAGCGTGHWEL